jgi:hypothetical protein
MGRDNAPQARQLERSAFKAARRASYARILIVTEGSKTEPLYLKDICTTYRLHSANVAVQPSQLGTAPTQVVQYAQQLFERGDRDKGIRPRSFDQVYAVFDRDDHASYFDALEIARALDGKLRNDAKEPVRFAAIASVPSFELWLLLHYQSIQAPMHRDAVMQRLKQHLPGYEKGAQGVFTATRQLLGVATQRADHLATQFSAHTAPEPYTGMADLVRALVNLR